ncbi:MAG TPA: hypothetical protein VKA95_10770 [Nitrososphaeraceae archaeon]|nr:hypothetical protein [Nitrososphaeraceae archaeon]
MVKFKDINEEDLGDTYDSKTFKGYKRYKQYQKQVEDSYSPDRPLIENKYFNCIYCGKVNQIEDIVKEKSENRTMRTRYLTWKKLRDISSEVGGPMENGLNYLISLHEGILSSSNVISDERQIGIAGFGGEDKKRKRKK